MNELFLIYCPVLSSCRSSHGSLLFVFSFFCRFIFCFVKSLICDLVMFHGYNFCVHRMIWVSSFQQRFVKCYGLTARPVQPVNLESGWRLLFNNDSWLKSRVEFWVRGMFIKEFNPFSIERFKVLLIRVNVLSSWAFMLFILNDDPMCLGLCFLYIVELVGDFVRFNFTRTEVFCP